VNRETSSETLSFVLLSFAFSEPAAGTGSRTAATTSQKDRTSVPEQDTSEEKEAAHLLHQDADLRAGEEVPQAEVSGFGRKSHFGQDVKDDGRTSQDLVPESPHKVEVSRTFTPFLSFLLLN
jgi:hypothetical protein